jgi:hypothetical protein
LHCEEQALDVGVEDFIEMILANFSQRSELCGAGIGE